MNRRATPNRAPILILLAVMIVVGVLVGQLASDSHAGADAAHSRDALVPTAGALSTSWYCAGGTAAPGGVADATIVLGNVGASAASATVTVMPGDTNTDPTTIRKSVSKDVTVAARSTERVRVGTILATVEAGVMVESRGGRLVVEQEVTGSGDVSLGPCARQPSSDWSFPVGTTEKGAQDWIALYNPFNDAAKVDVTSYTLDYSETPATPQMKVDVISSVSVDPNHETVIAALSDPDVLGCRDPVGVVVHASEGTIVAARRQQFSGFSFPPPPAAGQPAAPVYTGLTLGLGAPAPSDVWVFPEGTLGPGLRETIDVLNPGRGKATASVEFHLAGVAAPVTLTVDLPPRQVTRIDPTSSVQGKAHSVVVRHLTGPAIVAEQMVAANVAPTVGVTTNIGLTRRVAQWAFVPGRLDGSSGDGLRIFNPTVGNVRANLEVYSAGKLVPLGADSRVVMAPGGQWAPSLDQLGVPPDSVVVLVASAPVYGARIDASPGFTISNGVPYPAPGAPQA